MKTPYVRKSQEPRCSPWKTNAEGFRLIRVFSIGHNLQRFQHHVELMVKQDRRSPSGRRFTMKLRCLRRGLA